VTSLTESREIPTLRVTDEYDGSTVTSVSAIGPAPGHVSFTAETDAAVTACATFDPDSCLIEKHLAREYRAFTEER